VSTELSELFSGRFNPFGVMGRKAPEGDANTSLRQSDDSIEGAEPNRRH